MVEFAKINLVLVPGSPGFEGAFPFERHLGAQGEGGEFGHHAPDQFILHFFVSYKQLNYLNQRLELKVKKSKGCILRKWVIFVIFHVFLDRLTIHYHFHPHPMTRSNPFKIMQIGVSRPLFGPFLRLLTYFQRKL